MPDNVDLNHGQSDARLNLQHEPSTATLPEPILEESEPTTPNGSLPNTPRPENMSNIAKLIRRQSNSPENIRGIVSRRPSVAVSEHFAEDGPAEEMDDTAAGATEVTPLLNRAIQQDQINIPDDSVPGDIEGQASRERKPNHVVQLTRTFRHKAAKAIHIATSPKTWSRKAVWEQGIKHPVSLLPCVFLGVLLNVLDGLSYGMSASFFNRNILS